MNRILLIKYSKNKDKLKKIIDDNLYELHKRFVKIKFQKSNINKICLFGFDGKLKKWYFKLNVDKIIKDIKKMPLGDKINKKKFKNLSLYADYNPKTTIKGLGFKNKEKAIYTIKKIKDKDKVYKKRLLITMINRAKYHPHINNDMKDAIKIFKKELDKLN